MITLHDFLPSGNGYKCRLLLRFLGHPFTLKEYDITKGETRTPNFLSRLNPNGRIPVLELDDGRCLSESGAILNFVADGTAFLPDDPWDRARVLQWMFFEQYTLEPTIAVRRFWLTEQEAPLSEVQQAQLPQKLEQGHAALNVLEQGLSTGPWLVGAEPTIADIALYGYTHVAPEGGYELDAYPNTTAWIGRFRDLPGYVPITQRDFD
ncbi:MAG: glutathione S-transferase family protein [Rhodospirillales bacterium]